MTDAAAAAAAAAVGLLDGSACPALLAVVNGRMDAV